MKSKLLLYFLFIIQFKYIYNYKPVVLLHGILTGSSSMEMIVEEIEKNHPGTIVYTTDRFSGWASLETAWHQVLEFGNDLMDICKKHPDGVHLLGYSQGGLIGRVILETFDNHTVHNFISLSSPQAGQFGDDFLHLIFPNLFAKTAYELFYSRVGQHCAVGNYWNDPHHQSLYYKYSNFLPYANNEIESANSTRFRKNLLKLKRMILIGGNDDNVITPWESSHFGFYDENQEIIPMKMREIYLEDKIGLKSLDEENKLTLLTFPNVHHLEWHKNKTIIEEAILPYLD